MADTPRSDAEHLRVFINTLRKKINAKYIITEPWVGYRFEPTASDK